MYILNDFTTSISIFLDNSTSTSNQTNPSSLNATFNNEYTPEMNPVAEPEPVDSIDHTAFFELKGKRLAV